MSFPERAWPFLAGVCVANAVPHAYAALTGARHMTPLRGSDSGPASNAIWATMNAAGAGGLVVGVCARGPVGRRWFKGGVLAFSAWALVADPLFGFGRDEG